MAETNRRLTRLVYAAVASMVFVILLTLLTVPPIVRGASNSEDIKDSTDVASCRARYATAVNDAQAALLETIARMITVPQGQRPVFYEQVEAAAVMSQQARTANKEAVQRSIDDPDGFVADCKQGG